MLDNNKTVDVGTIVEDMTDPTNETITESVIDDSEPETQPEEGETKEEDTTEEGGVEFNPDEIDFSDQETTFGKYDLSKFKDNINFENSEAMDAFNQEAKKMEELGFTQEQVEYICESVLGMNEEVGEVKMPTKSEITSNLKKGLTIEEQRNYKAINSFVKEALKGTELESETQFIMSNPKIVKLVNAVYKKASGAKVINKANVEQKTDIKYTVDYAQNEYDKYLKSNPDTQREDKRNFLTGLYNKMPESEKEKFEDIFFGLFNK